MIPAEKRRKTRSDKKRDIKPSLPIELKENINRLSYITNTPLKDIGEYLLVSGIRSKKIIDQLSPYFRRDLQFGYTIFLGDMERKSVSTMRKRGLKDRLTIRLRSADFENISRLAFALDCTPSFAAALLIEVSFKDVHNLNNYVKQYFESELDTKRMKELKEILKYIEQNNPYDEKFSWMEMLNFFVEEVGVGITQFGRGVSKWIGEKMKK